jgi:hypothetical protein
MPDAIQMIAESMSLGPGSDDEHVAAADAAFKAVVKQEAISKPAEAEPKSDQ